MESPLLGPVSLLRASETCAISEPLPLKHLPLPSTLAYTHTLTRKHIHTIFVWKYTRSPWVRDTSLRSNSTNHQHTSGSAVAFKPELLHLTYGFQEFGYEHSSRLLAIFGKLVIVTCVPSYIPSSPCLSRLPFLITCTCKTKQAINNWSRRQEGLETSNDHFCTHNLLPQEQLPSACGHCGLTRGSSLLHGQVGWVKPHYQASG